MNKETIAALREAIKVSPDNVPLREHLANMLVANAQYEEAEREFTTALALAPNNNGLKIGLATASQQQGKYSQALVIVEDLLKVSSPPAQAHLIYARLMLNDGQSEKAADHYRKAVELDATLVDEALADQLKVCAAVPVIQPSAEPGDNPVWEELDKELNDYDAEKPTVTFEQVGGMDAVKEQVRMKIIYPITNSKLFSAYGKKIGGGILMYGPPGCGKTHLARATAGEIKAAFIAVGIADILDMWIGSSERNLHALFEQARRIKPCVLFFDEVDALAASRSDMRGSGGGARVINQFLNELDGVNTSNEGILILAATNAPWHLDSAFRRPGRFDRIIFVPPPDTKARADILRIQLAEKPVDPKFDFAVIAKKTEKYSGADIANLVDTAIERKLEQAMKTGDLMPLTTRDVEDAMRIVRPSTTEWFATAKNYAMYSNQGGVYDDVLNYMKTL